MEAIRFDSKISIPKDILFRELEGEAVLLNLKTGIYFGLNPLGTRIWHLIRKFAALKPVFAALLTEYDVDASRCKEDLRDLTASLQKSGLIRIGNA